MNRCDKVYGVIKSYILKMFSKKKIILKGKRIYIGRDVKLLTENNSTITLEEKVWLSDFDALISVGRGLYIGENTYLNSNTRIISMDKITIGKNCLIGPNVIIVDHDHNFECLEKLICKQGYIKSQVEIGNNIWIGANCTITRGVSICDNVVIGANSVVTKSISESGVYAGNPLKQIKK